MTEISNAGKLFFLKENDKMKIRRICLCLALVLALSLMTGTVGFAAG